MIGTLLRDGGGLVVAADGAHQHARRALALQVAVVVREVFYRERHVGVAQEFLVLVAVRIEGADDEGLAADHRAHPPRHVRLGPWHATHTHGAVQAEIDAVIGTRRRDLVDHPSDEGLVGLARYPTRTRAGLGKQRRFDADQLNAVELARHLHEAAHVGLRLVRQQRFALGGRAFVDEVVERGVVAEERHRLMDEIQDGDANRPAGHRVLLLAPMRWGEVSQDAGRKQTPKNHGTIEGRECLSDVLEVGRVSRRPGSGLPISTRSTA